MIAPMHQQFPIGTWHHYLPLVALSIQNIMLGFAAAGDLCFGILVLRSGA
jgi:hypothetical protein